MPTIMVTAIYKSQLEKPDRHEIVVKLVEQGDMLRSDRMSMT